jgi:elongation factor Ts
VEAKGNLEEAEVVLRKKGMASASKKAGRATRQGVIGNYIHAGAQIGTMVEVNCESDFVARNEAFLELVRDIAMQVAATDPRYVRREDVTEADLLKERDIARERARNDGKPENMLDKIAEGRMGKFYEDVCLLEQPFIKDNAVTIGDLVKQASFKLGENISVARFIRFKIGETQSAEEPAAE